eukprot:6440277-Alexandrium_andersonii.AAC.1
MVRRQWHTNHDRRDDMLAINQCYCADGARPPRGPIGLLHKSIRSIGGTVDGRFRVSWPDEIELDLLHCPAQDIQP